MPRSSTAAVRWLLRDTSTNGTFVNDSDEALGPDRLHQLSNGDRFRIGEYEIEVEITGGNDFPPGVAPVSVTDLDSSFGVKNFISTGRREREAQAARARRRRRRRPARRAASAAAGAASAPCTRGRDDQELWPGLAALCRAPGIDPIALPAEVRGTALQQAGQLLRETFVGFSELARRAAGFASEFGISSGARRRDATASFTQIAAVEQILEMVLAGRGPRRLRAQSTTRSAASSPAPTITRLRWRRRCAKRLRPCSS